MNDVDTVRKFKEKEFQKLIEQNKFEGDEDGNIILEPQRYNIMGSDYFMSEMLEMMSDIMGTGATGIARRTGKTYGDDLKESLNFDEKGPEDFGRFLGLLKRLGYSDPQVEEDRIIFPSSPTAEEHLDSEHEQKKTCYFLSGILDSGAELLDSEENFTEIKCKAEGAENCVFESD